MVELAPHQLKALGEMRNGCILKGGVGTGKTRTSLAYYIWDSRGTFPINGEGEFTPMKDGHDVYILTTAKKRNDLDWEDDALPFGLGKLANGNLYGREFTVDSWNNITKYEEVKDAFFIFDEQRLVGSGAWVQAFLKIAKHNRWIILSATPGDNWMDYIPVFIANGFYKNRTEFIREHVVFSRFTKFPKVDRYINTDRLADLRSRILVEMPFERHTKRHIENIAVQYDEALFQRVWKDRWHVYEDRPIRDVAELFAVGRKIINSDVSRVGAVHHLLEKHPRLIIFYNFNYELDILRQIGSTLGVETAEWNGHRHNPVPKSDRWLYLVQYTAGAEGWNCITTDAIAFWSLNYSWKITEQSMGRTDRMNTPYTDLYYYKIRSSSPIDMAIVKAQATKKVFNESAALPKHIREAFEQEAEESHAMVIKG